MRIKPFIKTYLPFLTPILRPLQHLALARKSPQRVFTDIYNSNSWGDSESVSGHGSNLRETEVVREALPRILEQHGCKSILDIPCGDFFWMSRLDLPATYIGADIVEALVTINQQRFGSSSRHFLHLDLTRDKLPTVDVVLCRDCLVHLSLASAIDALTNIKRSGSKFLLTTTFLSVASNSDIPTGAWRPINLQASPFNLPAPIFLVNERCPAASFTDKHLGMWDIAQLPDW